MVENRIIPKGYKITRLPDGPEPERYGARSKKLGGGIEEIGADITGSPKEDFESAIFAVKVRRAERKKGNLDRISSRFREKLYKIQNPEKVRESNRKYRVANREKVIALSAAWRLKNPTRRREWGDENREHVQKYKRDWRRKNRDVINAYQREYRSENPEIFAAQYLRIKDVKNAKRRAARDGTRMTAEERSEKSRRAANARWNK